MKKLLIIYLLLALIIQGLCIKTSSTTCNKYYGNNDLTNNETVDLIGSSPLYLNTNTNMYKYFSKLTTNIGNNETNTSCGYVALAMLLNYYDTYKNDNIVEEKYEVDAKFTSDKFAVPSPGTKNELNYNPADNDVAGYINYLRNYYVNSSLHAKLALIGINALTSNPSNLSSFMDTFGTTDDIITNTINTYFNMLPNNISYSVTKKSFASGNSVAEINSFIKTSINNGKPVYAGYGNHAIIIYGCSENNFVYHNGYVNDSNRSATLPDENPKILDRKINFAMTLDFNESHVCSHHYFNINTGDAYCYCGTQIHKEHVYCSRYVYYSNNQHKAYCSCGIYILDLHNFRKDFTIEDDCPCGAPNPFH